MLKRFVFIFAIFTVVISCKNSDRGTLVTINDFEMKAGELVGQVITIEGTVNHVCREGGKRMFIIDKDPDMSVKIMPGDNMPSFEVSLEGSEVIVTGVITEDFIIDQNYLDEWEAEIRKQHEEAMAADTIQTQEEEMEAETEHKEGHEDAQPSKVAGGDGAGHGDHHLTGFEKVDKWRKKLADSGKDKLVIYMVKATKVEEKTKK